MSSRIECLSVLAALGTAVLACHGEPGAPRTSDPDAAVVIDAQSADAPVSGCDLGGVPASVDLLVVVGNGERSKATRDALFTALPDFLDQLACQLGAPPDLHAGVVSTNLGAGGFSIPRCGGAGDDGIIETTAKIAGCQPPDGAFLTDTDDTNAGAGRVKNFTGTAAAALECVGKLPSTGCTFEQPLAAAVLATDGGRNPGFLRDEAVLVVLVASGGDDCSAASSALFDPGAAETLGPLGAFRCFEHGVECAPDEPRTVGSKSNCVPRSGPLVTPVIDLAATLVGRKSDPANVVFGFIGGVPDAVTVTANQGQLALASGCPQTPVLDAVPAIRTSAFPGAISALTCLPSQASLTPVAAAVAAAAQN